ncbi:Sec-independent protein translocase protein TatB [Beijerinckia mobilis]|uniref:Sec-independent protein translocase protein TatB n=1 Tax=Beijerinckia mobilis TaxID=231434 RepID=UPI000A0653C6|nr:Sec-independent protein translocase protein TatB [Beijerinckia mobilis]
MFDFDAGKLIIIGVVALIVIGPKDLPRVMRQVGQAVGRMRRMAADFQAQFMQAMHEADMEDIRANMEKLGENAKIEANFQPIHEVRNHLTGALSSPVASPAATATPATETPAVTPVHEPIPQLSQSIPEQAISSPAVPAVADAESAASNPAQSQPAQTAELDAGEPKVVETVSTDKHGVSA